MGKQAPYLHAFMTVELIAPQFPTLTQLPVVNTRSLQQKAAFKNRIIEQNTWDSLRVHRNLKIIKYGICAYFEMAIYKGL